MLNGQSRRPLITVWLEVRVLPGPPRSPAQLEFSPPPRNTHNAPEPASVGSMRCRRPAERPGVHYHVRPLSRAQWPAPCEPCPDPPRRRQGRKLIEILLGPLLRAAVPGSMASTVGAEQQVV